MSIENRRWDQHSLRFLWSLHQVVICPAHAHGCGSVTQHARKCAALFSPDLSWSLLWKPWLLQSLFIKNNEGSVLCIVKKLHLGCCFDVVLKMLDWLHLYFRSWLVITLTVIVIREEFFFRWIFVKIAQVSFELSTKQVEWLLRMQYCSFKLLSVHIVSAMGFETWSNRQLLIFNLYGYRNRFDRASWYWICMHLSWSV